MRSGGGFIIARPGSEDRFNLACPIKAVVTTQVEMNDGVETTVRLVRAGSTMRQLDLGRIPYEKVFDVDELAWLTKVPLPDLREIIERFRELTRKGKARSDDHETV